MGLISFTPLVDGSTAVNAAATNTPLSTIYNEFNGNITNANISASANIDGSKLASGTVSTGKQTATTWTGIMAALAPVPTSYSTQAFVVLPSVTVAHKYLIIASFNFYHAGAATTRDYTAAVRNGTTDLRTGTWTAIPGDFFNTVAINYVHTGATLGGETINFSCLRNTDSGGQLTNVSHFSVIDLGLA